MDVVFISIEQFIGALIIRVGAPFNRKGCDAYDLVDGDAAGSVIAGNVSTKSNTEMERGFSIYLCHGSDPQTKGRIENTVGVVKKDFLDGRKYYG